MSESNAKFLEVNNLVVQYTSAGEIIHAVNDVSFSVERGQVLALVGETGAGKTTIAKSILRILSDRAAKIVSGNIIFDGVDLLRLNEREMRKIRGQKISMVFQDPMSALNPTMKIGDQIAEVIKLHNDISKAEAKERTVEMLKMVNITPERYYEYPHQFSGGMKQRVIIAMALACNPELLLADEPTTALDVTIQAQVLEMMMDLRTKLGTAMILITHDLGIVASNADYVAVVYAGEIVEYGKMERIYDRPSHPYTIGLFNAIPNLEVRTKRLANISGFPANPANLPNGCSFAPRCPYATEECNSEKFALTKIGDEHFSNCRNIDAILEGEGVK